MKSISLTQLTAFVVAVCLASFFVNADEPAAQSNEESTVLMTQSDDSAEVVEEDSNDRFTFTSLDLDQNGKLSQKEAVAGNNQWLIKAFYQIDKNDDEALTEQELVDYATYMVASTN